MPKININGVVREMTEAELIISENEKQIASELAEEATAEDYKAALREMGVSV